MQIGHGFGLHTNMYSTRQKVILQQECMGQHKGQGRRVLEVEHEGKGAQLSAVPDTLTEEFATTCRTPITRHQSHLTLATHPTIVRSATNRHAQPCATCRGR